MPHVAPAPSRASKRRKAPIRAAASNVWPIRNKKDYDAAFKVVSDLALYPEGSLSPEDQARLDVFSDLLEAYDAVHTLPFFRQLTVIERLQNLMAEHGMSESDLGRLLGSRQSGNKIMSGKRELSKAHIRILSDHFGLSTDAFID